MTPKLVQKHPQEASEECKLFSRGPYDAKEEFEGSLYQSFISLQTQLTPPYPFPLQSSVDPAQFNGALVYAFLTQSRAQQSQQSLITHLTTVTTDGYANFVSILNRLVCDFYPKLVDQSRTQLLWLVRQLINLTASDVDNLCQSLLRCIVGGDVSERNIWLCCQMQDIFRSNWSWLIGCPGLLTSALFTFLRVLPDHFMAKNAVISELKQDEVTLCVKIMRERFQDCLVIGRDLVRLLQDVSFIPEFELVWRDLLSNPSTFNAAGFADIAQLYVVRTPNRYLTSRLTPEMENQIRFMLTYVRMGNQRRYQAWFAQRFLSAPGSETLVCDLIRFICCVHHPSNQILQSDIVPRWAVIGWLLKCCKSQHVEANAKLALFYDWFFFMSKTDNIMNIEPAILLMVYSIPKYMDITHSLLEFLFLCMDHYDPFRKDLIFRGVLASVDILVSKGVVRSLDLLSASSYVAPWLREKLVAHFPTYCQAEAVDALKGTKQENVQELQPPAPNLPGGSRNSVFGQSDMPVKQESNNVPEGTLLGNHHKDVDSELLDRCDVKPVDEDFEGISPKRRRLDVVTIEDFSKALTRSQKDAINIFEKLVRSLLIVPEKSNNNNNVEDGFDDLLAESLEATVRFAQEVSEACKSNRYRLFAPLRGHSFRHIDKDEIISVSSAALRMYSQLHHPQILQMLLCWRNGGYDVGARFLCYISILAEESNLSCTPSDVELQAEMVVEDSGKDDTNIHGNGDQTFQGSQTGKLSALSWHLELQVNEFPRISSNRGLSEASEVASNDQQDVSNAFRAYKEYLKGVKRSSASSSGVSPSDEKLPNGMANEEARSHSDEDLEILLIQDLETCLTWNIHRFLIVLLLVFRYLPDICRGKEQIIKLLVSVLDPMELSKLEIQLSLRELLVIGSQPMCIASLVNKSLSWDCFEQQYLWRLIIAELQNIPTPHLTEFVKCCTTFIEPLRHHDALSGLTVFLRTQYPTVQLISTFLSLPHNFSQFVATVFANWVSVDATKFLSCLNESLQRNDAAVKIDSHGSLTERNRTLPLPRFLKFLDTFHTNNFEVDEKKREQLSQIKHILLQMAKKPNLYSKQGGREISEQLESGDQSKLSS